MTTLNERYVVRCPYGRARKYLAETVENAAADGRVQKLALNVELGYVPGDLRKNVLVHYAPGSDPMHFEQPWCVSWIPEDGGPYPDFKGELTVREDESYRTAILELKGEYKPPLGIPGLVFDAAVGHRLASATAQNLLASIAAAMRARYLAEEASKQHVSPT